MLTAAQLGDRFLALSQEFQATAGEFLDLDRRQRLDRAQRRVPRDASRAAGGAGTEHAPSGHDSVGDALDALRVLVDALSEAWWVKAAAALESLRPLATASRTSAGRSGLARVGARVAWESAGHVLSWSELGSERRDELAAAFERGLAAILSTSAR